MGITAAEYTTTENDSVKVTYDDGQVMHVPNDLANRHRRELQEWLAEGNTISPYTEPPESPEARDARLKLEGVEFNGVMCSACKEDMWGLNAIEQDVIAGNPTFFNFENGNNLLLNENNYEDFKAVWIPFRRSFFPLP